MAKRVAADRPLSFEDVGVIGADGVESDVEPRFSEQQTQAAARPADGAADLPVTYPANFDRVEEPEGPQEQQLPEGWENWQGFKMAAGGARDDFRNAVLFPGHEFIAGGRYVDAQNVNKVFDVEPGMKSPEGLFLLGINYLVPSPEKDKILRGEQAPRRATRQADPLRPQARRDEE